MSLLFVHATDHEHLDDARLPGAGHDLAPIRIELRHVDVRMAIDQRERLRFCHSSHSKADRMAA